MNVKITAYDHHRNGVGGECFDVCLFDYGGDGGILKMLAILWDSEVAIGCAVLNVDQTMAGNIAMAQGNSWRGDQFYEALKPQIDEWNKKLEKERTP